MWHSGGGEDNWLYSMASSKGIIILMIIFTLPHSCDDNPDTYYMLLIKFSHVIGFQFEDMRSLDSPRFHRFDGGGQKH